MRIAAAFCAPASRVESRSLEAAFRLYYGTAGAQDRTARNREARTLRARETDSTDLPSAAVLQFPDVEEVARARSGDGDAYARLIERYRRPIAQQMWRFTRDPGRHAELVQNVFVNTYIHDFYLIGVAVTPNKAEYTVPRHSHFSRSAYPLKG